MLTEAGKNSRSCLSRADIENRHPPTANRLQVLPGAAAAARPIGPRGRHGARSPGIARLARDSSQNGVPVLRKTWAATRRPGAWKPLNIRLGVGRDGAAILDHMVGEPVTYTTGFRAKGHRDRDIPVFQLPDQGQERSLRGRTADEPLLTWNPTIADDARSHARRAYRIVSVSV